MLLEEFPLGNHVVPISRVPGLDLAGRLGEAKLDEDGARIGVADSLPEALEDEVIAHEIIHQWLFKSGATNLFSEEKCEYLCDALGDYLAQLIRYTKALPPKELEEAIKKASK